jgi:hypothetical protein
LNGGQKRATVRRKRAADPAFPSEFSRQRRDRIVMTRVKAGQDVLEYEIREEQAATIGRLSRELRAALDALRSFNRQGSGEEPTADHCAERARLVDAAAYALWHFVVQRECSGFRGTEQILREYAVPAEVRVRMGIVRPR